MRKTVKDQIIKNGIKNLKVFGYPNVTVENIMTDEVYIMFFENQLKDNLGHGFDEEIMSLLNDLGQKP